METADQLVARVTKTYATCTTYMDEGTHTTVFIKGPNPWDRRTTRKFFRTAFERGGRFLFEYRVQEIGPESEWDRSALWVDRDGCWEWSTRTGCTERAKSLKLGLAALTGVSGGTASFASMLLMPELAEAPRLPTTEISMSAEVRAADGKPCCVLKGKNWLGRPESYWIEEDHALVVRNEDETVFDRAHFAGRLARMQARLSRMSADDEHRPVMEKMVADLATGEREEFRTECITLWRPSVNVEISDEAFVCVPPVA